MVSIYEIHSFMQYTAVHWGIIVEITELQKHELCFERKMATTRIFKRFEAMPNQADRAQG